MSMMKDNFTRLEQDFVLHERDEGQNYGNEAGFCPSSDHSTPINLPALLFLTPKSKNGNNNDDGPY